MVEPFAAKQVWLCWFFNALTRLSVAENQEAGPMPRPDPDAIWLERHGSRVTGGYVPYFQSGTAGHRKARAEAITRRMLQGTWRCEWCGADLPVWKRADAVYCREACRKATARSFRKANP